MFVVALLLSVLGGQGFKPGKRCLLALDSFVGDTLGQVLDDRRLERTLEVDELAEQITGGDDWRARQLRVFRDLLDFEHVAFLEADALESSAHVLLRVFGEDDEIACGLVVFGGRDFNIEMESGVELVRELAKLFNRGDFGIKALEVFLRYLALLMC